MLTESVKDHEAIRNGQPIKTCNTGRKKQNGDQIKKQHIHNTEYQKKKRAKLFPTKTRQVNSYMFATDE